MSFFFVSSVFDEWTFTTLLDLRQKATGFHAIVAWEMKKRLREHKKKKHKKNISPFETDDKETRKKKVSLHFSVRMDLTSAAASDGDKTRQSH